MIDLMLPYIGDVYKYLTGILILWGAYSSHVIFKTIMTCNKHYWDFIYLIVIMVITLFLFGSIFIFTGTTVKHLFALLALEIWYIVYAVYFTFDYIIPTYKNILKKKPIPRG
jgi:hypothetical protein